MCLFIVESVALGPYMLPLLPKRCLLPKLCLKRKESRCKLFRRQEARADTLQKEVGARMDVQKGK